jgi:hypothetical protein
MNTGAETPSAAPEAAPVKGAAQASEAVTAPENVSVTDLGAMFADRRRKASQPAEPKPEVKPENEEAVETEGLPEAEQQQETPEETTPPAAPESAAEEAAEPEIPAEETATASVEGARLPPEVAAAIEEAKLGKSQAKIVRRIHELADQRDRERNARLEAERQRDQALEQAAQAGRVPPQPLIPSQDPLNNSPEVKEITTALNQAERVISWAEENPDGGEVNGQAYSAEEIAQLKSHAERNRTELLAERAAVRSQLRSKLAEAEATFRHQAATIYPWMARPDALESKEVAAILQQLPQVKAFPNWPLVLGDYIAGRKAREAAMAARAAGKGQPGPSPSLRTTKVPPAREPTPVVARSGATPTRTNGADREVEQAQKELESTGDVRALGRLFTAKRKARASG